ncbi:MAG: metallophosphoesterase [Bacteroidales bacterium]|nr:metallophosphoesterase [Bacteroidales bacterium]
MRHSVFERKKIYSRSKSISRANFILKIGAVLSMVPVLGLIHGIAWGRFHFTLHRNQVKIKGLPVAFNGFKIVQLSDAHLGSLAGNEYRISDVMKQINELNPDIVVFTGDMVNNFANEISGWVPVWKQLKASSGKFSVLGNHDYGGYSTWPSENARKKNTYDNIRQQREMGFDVLLNEHRVIKRDGSSLYLAGVENWGKPPFPQHGKLDLALEGIPNDATVILLSHDPDHFEMKVRAKTNVDLTLSGHTHGAQFGVEIGKFKMSPVSLRFKRWAGMYKEGDQYLYVNRGLGYIAFPGRVGIWPEITLLELVTG